jgi:hypothetical protein
MQFKAKKKLSRDMELEKERKKEGIFAECCEIAMKNS